MVLARYQSSKLQVSRFGRADGLAHFPFIWDNRLAIFRYVGKIWDGWETRSKSGKRGKKK